MPVTVWIPTQLRPVTGGKMFDAVSWTDTAKANVSWDAVSWDAVSWADASWSAVS